MATKFQTPDFMKAFEGIFQSVPTDFGAVTGAANDAVVFSGKLSAIALGAAQKNVELSAAWSKDVLAEMLTLTEPQDQVTDYVKRAATLTTAQLQATPERMAGFAEVAKSAQMDATELFTQAGKDLQSKFTTAA